MTENQEQAYGFDPTEIIKVIVENKDLGLALVQIPLTLLNNWIGGDSKKIEWDDRPKVPGYYWIKNLSDVVSVTFIGPDNLATYSRSQYIGYQFAGPLVPPK